MRRIEQSRLLGLTASRPIGERGNAFLSAYADLDCGDAFGIFADLSRFFGNNGVVATGVQTDSRGTSLMAEASGRRSFIDSDLDWLAATAKAAVGAGVRALPTVGPSRD